MYYYDNDCLLLFDSGNTGAMLQRGSAATKVMVISPGSTSTKMYKQAYLTGLFEEVTCKSSLQWHRCLPTVYSFIPKCFYVCI